jgi:hypothetical protein
MEYEKQYCMSTDVLLRMIEGESPLVAAIPDAGFWRSAYELLQRMKKHDSCR